MTQHDSLSATRWHQKDKILPTWPQDGPLGTSKMVLWPQRRVDFDVNLLSPLSEAPRQLQNNAKGYQDYLKMAEGGHDGPMMVPKWPHDRPKMAQGGPRWPMRGPGCLQDVSKIAQRGRVMARVAQTWARHDPSQKAPRVASKPC